MYTMYYMWLCIQSHNYHNYCHVVSQATITPCVELVCLPCVSSPPPVAFDITGEHGKLRLGCYYACCTVWWRCTRFTFVCDILQLHESILSGLACNPDLSNDIANGQLHVLIQNHHLNMLHVGHCLLVQLCLYFSLLSLFFVPYCTCWLPKGPPSPHIKRASLHRISDSHLSHLGTRCPGGFYLLWRIT